MAGLCKKITIILLGGYRRFLSSSLPPSCRFFPSCSAYTSEAIERYGIMTGCRLALRRLFHCHPLNPGGYDPVP